MKSLQFAIPIAVAVSLSACSQNGGVPPAHFTAPLANAEPQVKGFGTVFAVTTSGQERVVYRFQGSSDGAYPLSRLIAIKGTLYGTTSAGGAENAGTVFAVTPQGDETVLHSFGGTNDGADPQAGLINVKGTLYGTTYAGGTKGYGTVFSITTSGVETVLHSFPDSAKDGGSPSAPLLDVKGTLYGTTRSGGYSSSLGTIFKITVQGSESVVATFDAKPFYLCCPYAGLTAIGKDLAGTGAGGGAYRWGGGVFKCTASGNATVIHSFSGNKGKEPDGWTPESDLTDVNGTLYGTTYKGGTYKSGVVYQISSTGAESVVYEFHGSGGRFPLAGILDVNGTLYGTTSEGGTHDAGTIFSLTPSGQETVIHDFGAAGDGRFPQSDLIDVNGTLYGTTSSGV